jgi:thiol-disulfide isomerase/thioredoxin
MPRRLLFVAIVAACVGCGGSTQAPPFGELTAGLEKSDNLEEITRRYDAWHKAPDGVGEQLDYIEGLLYLAKLQMQDDRTDKAHACWKAAGEVAEKVAKQKLEMEQWNPVAAGFFYAGCERSAAGDIPAAERLIERAIDFGFAELNEVQNVEELTPLIKKRGLDELMATWEAKAREVAKKRAEAVMHETQPFTIEFAVQDLAGKPQSSAALKGSVAILDIWGTWCPPCRKEIPHFVKLVDRYGERLHMLGLNYQEDDPDDVRAFIKKNKINYPCALGPEEVEKAAAVEGFPTTLFLDRHGQVRAKAVGYHDYYLLEGIVETLLAEK